MKVIVTGSRLWDDYNTIYEALRQFGASVVVHGGARGADAMAKRAARALRILERSYPADWAAHGRAAGPLRNQAMLDAEHTPDAPVGLVLGFPMSASRGTWDMVRRAERAGVKVMLFRPPLCVLREGREIA